LCINFFDVYEIQAVFQQKHTHGRFINDGGYRGVFIWLTAIWDTINREKF